LLVAPYNPDPRQWRKLRWTNRYKPGSRYAITTGEGTGGGLVRVSTYRDVLDDYRAHPEAKLLGPDGKPCERYTRGLLQRRHIRAARIIDTGKEANKVEEREAALALNPAEYRTDYRDPTRDPFYTVVVPILRE